MPEPADLCLVGGHVADVRAGVLRRVAVAVRGGRIAAVGPDEALAAGAAEVLDVAGRVVAPGYIEPHTHAVLANPLEYAGALLRRGTTTAAVDTLPFLLQARLDRLPRTLEDLAAASEILRWQIRLHPPAFSREERFALEVLRPLWRLPSVLAVGEVTRWTDVYDGAPDLRAKIAAARADGRRVEGHAPGASRERLAVLAGAGFSVCHEAVTASEVADRLRAGLYAMLRHSPIRPDLPQLAQSVKTVGGATDRLMLTVDGPSPVFVEEHGYLDHVLRVATDSGMPPLLALRLATLNPAAYYGLTDRGEVAPDRRADLNVIPDLADPRPEVVIVGGRVAARDGRLVAPLPAVSWEEMFEPPHLPRPAPAVFAAPADLPPCRLVNDVITKPGGTSDAAVQAVLLDREGRWMTRCALAGFVDDLGGLATTVNTAGDLIVVGRQPADMARAAARVAAWGGGLVVWEGGQEVFALPLDLGGIFTSRPWAEVVAANRRFNEVMRARGYRFTDPLFSLMFLTFDSLPWIRLTSRGVWDVRRRRVLAPPVPL